MHSSSWLKRVFKAAISSSLDGVQKGDFCGRWNDFMSWSKAHHSEWFQYNNINICRKFTVMKRNSNWRKLKQHYAKKNVLFFKSNWVHFPDKPSALKGSCYFCIIYDQKHLHLHRQTSLTLLQVNAPSERLGLLKVRLFHNVAFGCSGWCKVRKRAVKRVKPSVWSFGSWDVRSQFDCRNSRTWKDEVGFRPPQRFDVTAVCLIVCSNIVSSRTVCSVIHFGFIFFKISWEHAEEPSAPASVPAAPQFLGHVWVFFVFFSFVRAQNLQQVGPLNRRAPERPGWSLSFLIFEPLKPQLLLYRNLQRLCERRGGCHVTWLVYLHVYIYYPMESIWVWMLCNGWVCPQWRKTYIFVVIFI